MRIFLALIVAATMTAVVRVDAVTCQTAGSNSCPANSGDKDSPNSIDCGTECSDSECCGKCISGVEVDGYSTCLAKGGAFSRGFKVMLLHSSSRQSVLGHKPVRAWPGQDPRILQATGLVDGQCPPATRPHLFEPNIPKFPFTMSLPLYSLTTLADETECDAGFMDTDETEEGLVCTASESTRRAESVGQSLTSLYLSDMSREEE